MCGGLRPDQAIASAKAAKKSITECHALNLDSADNRPDFPIRGRHATTVHRIRATSGGTAAGLRETELIKKATELLGIEGGVVRAALAHEIGADISQIPNLMPSSYLNGLLDSSESGLGCLESHGFARSSMPILPLMPR